jgi:serine/threonine protein kinase
MSIYTPQATAGSLPSGERRRRVAALVEDAAVRRLRGESIGDDALIAAHPELLPELREQLEFLRAVELARDAAPAQTAISDRETTCPSATSLMDESDLESTTLASDAVPGYRVLREISRGGQGVVFEATQLGTKRNVAIKVLHAGTAATSAARRRFEREVELVAHLTHPNIISIFHSGVTPDGRDFYVMDYVEGMPLRDWVRERKPPLEDVLRLFGAICDAVQYAHQRGVLHRDLKPSNILIADETMARAATGGATATEKTGTRSGMQAAPVSTSGTRRKADVARTAVTERSAAPQPKILDFGLARSLLPGEEEALTLSDQVLGTLPYMSPEQAAGHTGELDTRTDVYALGVILYELLTGVYPYPVAGKLMEVLRHIAETPPTPPTAVWKRESGVAGRSRGGAVGGACPIDDEIQTIVLKALSKERERRYQSAGEMARDVGRYLSGDPIEAKRDSTWYVLRKLARRNAAATTMVASVAVILIGSAIISAFFYQGAQQELARRTEREAALVRENEQHRALARGAQLFHLGAFLLEWQAGRDERARELRGMLFLVDSPERKVMDFLLDPGQDVESLRVALGGKDAALADFALGERETKAGNAAAARAAYGRALDRTQDAMLRGALRARLRE